MAEIKRDKKTLTAELKAALMKGRNFLYAPSDAPEKDIFLLSKKTIPPAKRSWAKIESGAAKVFWGTCFKHAEEGIPVFEVEKPVPGTLAKKLKATIKKQTGLNWAKLEIRMNSGSAQKDFSDENDKKDEAPAKKSPADEAKLKFSSERALRLSVISKGVVRLKKAKSSSLTTIQNLVKSAKEFEGAGNWNVALEEYDKAAARVKEALKVLDRIAKANPPDRSKEFHKRRVQEWSLFKALRKSPDLDPSALQPFEAILTAASEVEESRDWEHGFKLFDEFRAGISKLVDVKAVLQKAAKKAAARQRDEARAAFKAPDFEWEAARWKDVKKKMVAAGVLPEAQTGLARALAAHEKTWETVVDGDGSSKVLSRAYKNLKQVVAISTRLVGANEDAECMKYFARAAKEFPELKKMVQTAYKKAKKAEAARA